MRYYIEEEVDNRWEDIKKYILGIKDFTTEMLIDEIINNIQVLYRDSSFPFDPIWLESQKNGFNALDTEALITKALEEKYYIMCDDIEHEWNKHVVHSVMNNKGWIHRWNNKEYK